MSSISAVAQTPPPIPVTPAKPVESAKPSVTSAGDHDGDKDNGAAPAAAKPPGQGQVVDIKA